MANKISLVTIGKKWILELDSDPSIGAGFNAPIGSEALVVVGGVGSNWAKFGSANTDWRNLFEGAGATTINGMTDVNVIPTLATGQVLTYNAVNGKWENKTPAGASASIREEIFSFDGSFFPMTNFDKILSVIGTYTLTKIIVTAFASGDTGTNTIQVNVGNGPSGSMTTTASVAANGGKNSTTTTLIAPLNLVAGDLIWLDLTNIANGYLENLTVQLIME